MRNIFLLIRRSHVLLLFLLLQGISISMLVKYNQSQQAKYLQVAYEVTGRINKQYNGFTRYFSLNQNNLALAQRNAELSNQLASNFVSIDTLVKYVADTVRHDSTREIRKYIWRSARVINNSISQQNNFFTLMRGRNQGVEPEMAVTAPNGIIGVVTDVSDNMSIVMSLLNRKSSTSVMLKKDSVRGSLYWDGQDPDLLQLKEIPKSTVLKVGDTVLTSTLSLNYPGGLMVGTIAKAVAEKGGNNYQIQVKPSANFRTVQYVDVIENMLRKEQQELEEKKKKGD